MQNKVIFYFIGIVIVVGGIIYFMTLPTTAPTIDGAMSPNEEAVDSNMPVPGESATEIEVNSDGGVNVNLGDVLTGPAVKIYNVTGTPFEFSVKEMRVKKGDTVQVVFTNGGGFHNWVIDEFNASTKQISAGQTETIEFVADKSGIFEYYCSVGNHRQQGMVGKLIVE